uniref:Multi-pass membrane protein(Major facilitator superfamily) n=1 Tax=Magnetococcus massalia (strain MO-1) TaxID=451514 RepID=A0A1S7LF52_MAGMO|nr:Multi-pass membrane protein(major facilitator superfamily) [Candidatus Magnetococcus massalia]
MIQSLREVWGLYSQKRVLAVLFLGFSSGLPLALTLGTLTLWLAEEGISKTSIGLFALVGTPYAFKFVWAPLVDQLPVPWLTRRFGRRRGWALFTQLGLMLSIFFLGGSSPVEAPMVTAVLALITAFMSASQDIVIDAYRVELLENRQQGAGAAMVVLGYRIGMLVSGAGALYLASFMSWQETYAIMALCMLVGMVTVLLNPEPVAQEASGATDEAAHGHSRSERVTAWVKRAVIAPFAAFMSRPGWFWIIIFILLYKLGDALAGVMSNPFYLELAFSKIEIANITKAFGLAASIVGGLAGGWVVSRMGIMQALLWCGVLQMLSNLMFVVLAQVGHSLTWLTITIAIENLAGGMGTAAFVAYLSGLCNLSYTATQYALLSSLAAVGRTMLAANAGWMAEMTNWTVFYGLTTLAAIPGLLMLFWMMRRFPVHFEPHGVVKGESAG